VSVNLRDLAAGLAFVVIGLAFGVNAWLSLRIGEAQSMGPGYFPVLLGLVLIGFGVAVALSAVAKPAQSIGLVPWRGIILVTGAIVFFGLTVRGLGMVPALGVATTLAALASGRMSWVEVILLVVGLTTFCVLVFLYALQLPYPVLGPWLRF
jgi:hypothetical protein